MLEIISFIEGASGTQRIKWDEIAWDGLICLTSTFRVKPWCLNVLGQARPKIVWKEVIGKDL